MTGIGGATAARLGAEQAALLVHPVQAAAVDQGERAGAPRPDLDPVRQLAHDVGAADLRQRLHAAGDARRCRDGRCWCPRGIAATARICSAGTREAPATSTLATAKRGVVSSQRSAAPPAAAIATSARPHAEPAGAQAGAPASAARRSDRPTRWPPTSAERSPRSASTDARCLRRAETARHLLADDPDLVLERDREVRLHALARQVHEGQDVGGGGAAAVDDEVGVLGGDLRAVDALALEPDLLDQPRRDVARPGSSRRSRPRRAPAAGCDFLTLSRCFISFWISASGRRCSRRRQPISTAPGGALNAR